MSKYVATSLLKIRERIGLLITLKHFNDVYKRKSANIRRRIAKGVRLEFYLFEEERGRVLTE